MRAIASPSRPIPPHINTRSHGYGMTRYERPIARIEWHTHPTVEIDNIVPRMPASQLIPLSRDMAYRTMSVRGRQYALAPAPQGANVQPSSRSIQLYHTGSNPADMLGMFSRHPESLVLEMAPEAMRHGILEVSVVVGLLLYSGRSCD
ncbi:hypothetical protein NMY22_g10085 [Coprinellus aureogranulatus]|nr:hypothetical protein NMY22_g10085 [Coprinellus aureogranulatus]